MKTSSSLRNSQTIFSTIALFVATTLATSQLALAQTYRGEPHLKASPVELRAQVIKMKQGLAFQVNVETSQTGPVTVQIRDANGKTLFNEVYYTSKFSRVYDLSSLGEGTYTFAIQGRSGEAYTRSYRFSYPGPEAIVLDGSNGKPLIATSGKELVQL